MVKKNTPGCGCCLGTCGECADTMPTEITVDLGITNWTSNDDQFYYTTCQAPCESFEGEYVLTYNTGTESFCRWYYSETFCYTYYDDFFTEQASTYQLSIMAFIVDIAGTWNWTVVISIIPLGTDIWGGGYREYRNPTTTSCLGTTSLARFGDAAPPGQFWGSASPGSWHYKPCNDTPESFPDYQTPWSWPATIDVTA